MRVALRATGILVGVVCSAVIVAQNNPPAGGHDVATAGGFRVCSDPQNMPFSNDRLEGFENRIATLIAKDFGTTPTYIWWGQRRGFIRNTMNATLEQGRCDVVIGVPAQYDLVRTTKPY